MWLEDILYGALANGVNKPTILALNAAFLGCILSLLALLVLCISGAPALVPHVGFLLFLAVGLSLLINWFIQEVGTVEPKDQRRELFGEDEHPQPAAAVISLATSQEDALKED